MAVTKGYWNIGIQGEGQILPHDGCDVEALLSAFVVALKAKGHTIGSWNLSQGGT